jgi:hypothetical protein
MTGATPNPSLEDVLDAFSVENTSDRATLERYLRLYPNYATALIDLSRELHRDAQPTAGPETAEDEARINFAWRRHVEAGSKDVVVDPFAALSIIQLRNLAKTLDVPRQVITAFRQRKVIMSSVPRRFLGRLAAELNSTLDRLMSGLAVPASVASATSYKADAKPSSDEPVTFERVLIDAGGPDEKRARLLAEVD